jgi:hypothetical protein
MLDQPLSRRLRAIRESDAADLGPAVEPEPEPQSLAAPRRAPLGRLLVEKGAISETQLDDALERQDREGKPLGQILLEMGAVTHQDLARTLTGQHGIDPSDSLRRRLAADGDPGSGDDAVEQERYLVRSDGSADVLHTADTFLDAADVAFELIEERDPDRGEIVRSRAGELEHVWSYEREDAPGAFASPPDAA